MGERLRQSLNVRVGDTITLTTHKLNETGTIAPRYSDYEVLASFLTKRYEFDNTLGLNPGQMVSTKVKGFRQTYDDFRKLEATPSAAYFPYRDENNPLRYNYFQWFALPGSSTATVSAPRPRNARHSSVMACVKPDVISVRSGPATTPRTRVM